MSCSAMSRSADMSLRAVNALFPDEDAARGWFERARWPHSPQCSSCGVVGNAAWLKARRKWRCRPCLGITATEVNPAYSWQTCSNPDRGYVDKRNRPSQDRFSCCDAATPRTPTSIGHRISRSAVRSLSVRSSKGRMRSLPNRSRGSGSDRRGTRVHAKPGAGGAADPRLTNPYFGRAK